MLKKSASPRKPKYTPFGKEVVKRMADMDINQRELSEIIGVPNNYLTQLLRGVKGAKRGSKHHMPIAKYLGIDIKRFYT